MPGPTSIAEVESLANRLQARGLIGPKAHAIGDHVQVRIRGEVFCARVVEVLELALGQPVKFRVRLLLGGTIVPGSWNVRRCQTAAPMEIKKADGTTKFAGCTCGAADAKRSASGAPQARVSMGPPLGNTGITTQPKGRA